MRKELEKNYDPKDIEDRLYSKWISKKYFHAEVNPDKKPYTIVIPPPNITGQLHMGHALDNTLQDILIRFKRMQGYEALWLPGTDHASIATEAKIVEAMRNEGITKEDIPNDEREDDPDAAIIYGSDYDELADKFANIIGISRNAEGYEN